jgi:hypothetical protein
MYKKAQSGINAAVLVAIIGALIILFVLFSSTEDKEDFLNISNSRSSSSTGSGGINGDILLLEHPGTLIHLTKNEIEHELPSINLFSRTESNVFKYLGSIHTTNSVFNKKEQQVDFSISNPRRTTNVLLSFNVLESKGNLIISLNGREIYNREINNQNPNPVVLPKDLLEQNNVLVLSASGVGFNFLRTNVYNLENVKVTGDETDVSSQSSEIEFIIEQEEESNLESAKLRFVPECNLGDVGKLDVYINTNRIFSSVPDCGISQRALEFDYRYLSEGENTLLFSSQEGNYLIDRIKITTKLRETPSYSYTFDINDDQFDEILDDEFFVNISMKFFDDFEDKAADIFVNANRFSMPRTKASYYSRDINNFVENGVNTLKVVPKTTFEIDDLKIELVKIDEDDR